MICLCGHGESCGVCDGTQDHWKKETTKLKARIAELETANMLWQESHTCLKMDYNNLLDALDKVYEEHNGPGRKPCLCERCKLLDNAIHRIIHE